MTVICYGLLVFMDQAINFFSYMYSSCLGATLTKRSIHMSLCLAISVFLVMLAYANHLCNLPVGNPAKLVTFASPGQGLSPAVNKVACLLQS